MSKNKGINNTLKSKGTKGDKPIVKLTGTDGNVFSIIGKVAGRLRKAGLETQARDFKNLAMEQSSYGGVLRLAGKYVNIK